MPKETSIPIEIDKDILTVPKEKISLWKQSRTFVPKKGMTPIEIKKKGQTNDGTNLYSITPNIMMVPIGTINSRTCLKKWGYKLG